MSPKPNISLLQVLIFYKQLLIDLGSFKLFDNMTLKTDERLSILQYIDFIKKYQLYFKQLYDFSNDLYSMHTRISDINQHQNCIHIFKSYFHKCLYNIFQQKMSLNSTIQSKLSDKLLQQYPGLKIDMLPQQLKDYDKLACLCNYIDYGIPKIFYSNQMADYQEQLFNYCLLQISQHNKERQQLDSINEQRSNEISIIEDKPNSLITDVSVQMSAPKKMNAQEIKEMMKKFSLQKDKDLVNSEVQRAVFQFNRVTKDTNMIDLKLNNKKMTTQKKDNYSKSAQNGGNINRQKKLSKMQQGLHNQKKAIKIEVGKNISLDIKIKRSEVKKLAQNSFTVQFDNKYKELTDVEQAKHQISYLINRVSPQFLIQVKEEVCKMITVNKELCESFIQGILKTCLRSYPSTIKTLISLVKQCTKIPVSSFIWQLDTTFCYKKKLNNFHVMFTDHMQQKFNQTLVNIKNLPKQFNSCCISIGQLIYFKCFSTKIFTNIIQIVLTIILQNKCDTDNYFKGLILILQTLKQKSLSMQQKDWNRKLKTPIRNSIIEYIGLNELPNSIIDILDKLNTKISPETSLIECLLVNLRITQQNTKNQINSKTKLAKKQVTNNQNESCASPAEQQAIRNQQERKNLEQKQIREQRYKIHELICAEDVKIDQLKKIYESSNNKIQTMNIFISWAYDGKKENISHNISTFTQIIECNDQNIENFKILWNKKIENFYIQQCDFPLMTEILAQIIHYFLPQNHQYCYTTLQEDHEDYYDCQYFISKLFAKLQYHAEVQNV